nr:DMT family transporter [Bacillus sp. FJAT-47783]
MLGACSYGILSMIVKLAYSEGFTASEVVGSQYFLGWFMILILFLFTNKKMEKGKSLLLLGLIGMMSTLTGKFYGESLEEIPASIAVVLLFQFSWLGILLDAFVNRRKPTREEVISIFVLMIGTFMAGAIFEETSFQWTWRGVFFGLLAAVSFTFFIFFNGKVTTNLSVTARTFITATGSVIMALVVLSPEVLWNGSISQGLWKYGILLGLFGLIIPVYCFSIGVPKVGASLSSILGAFELPTAILASAFVLHEHISRLQWVGIFLILIGMFIPQLANRQNHSIQNEELKKA